MQYNMSIRKIISIHAPPRGATSRRWCGVYPLHFNSRPSARGDANAALNGVASVAFQFTPLREGRRKRLCGALRAGVYFNSRPSARGDHPAARRTRRSMYFNSRPSARGDGKRYAISANLLFNPYKSAWLNNRATQFVEIILVIFHRIIA